MMQNEGQAEISKFVSMDFVRTSKNLKLIGKSFFLISCMKSVASF